MKSITTMDYPSPFGHMILGEYDGKICLCDWKYRKMRNSIDQRIAISLQTDFQSGESEILEECKRQLEEYFNTVRKSFELPLLMVGTDFQKKVWDKLLHIRYGTTMSYLDLSKRMGDPKAIRAVAAANGANAMAILVPCHRVIGKNGEMTGYAGGIRVKKQLLDLEQADLGRQLELF